MTSATEAWMKRIDKINKTLLHRPTDPDSSAYQELMKKNGIYAHYYQMQFEGLDAER